MEGVNDVPVIRHERIVNQTRFPVKQRKTIMSVETVPGGKFAAETYKELAAIASSRDGKGRRIFRLSPAHNKHN